MGKDERFLIAQRPLDGLLGGLWEFPGGKQEAGESLPAALEREIQEELALEIRVGDHLISIKHAYTHFRITLHAYHAAYVAGSPQHLGVADHAWVTLAELDRYAFAVTDQKIIAALRAAM
jgi:A/G-specific adenine glycosylase